MRAVIRQPDALRHDVALARAAAATHFDVIGVSH
jgi:hypothetical protein